MSASNSMNSDTTGMGGEKRERDWAGELTAWAGWTSFLRPQPRSRMDNGEWDGERYEIGNSQATCNKRTKLIKPQQYMQDI